MALTGLAFLGVYLAGLAMALFRNPVFGFYTYMLAFYGHPPSRWWGSWLPDLRWSLLAAIVTLIGLSRLPHPPGQARWYQNPFAKCLIAYVIILWMQVPLAITPNHMEGTILFTKYLVLFYIIQRLIVDQRMLEHFAIAHVLGCGYFGYLAIASDAGGRLEGVGGPGVNDANTLGMHMATGIAFAAALLLRGSRNARIVAFLCAPLILNCIILTQSRGAFLGLVVAGAALMWLKPPQVRKLFWRYAALGILAFLLLAHDFFYERVLGTFDSVVEEGTEQLDNSALSRFAIIEAQWNMFLDHPFGGGFDTTTWLSDSYIDVRWHAKEGGRSSHNTFMSVLVDQGIPGLILFVIVVLSTAFAMRRLRRMDRLGLPPEIGIYRAATGAALACTLISGIFTNYLKAEVQIWCLALIPILLRFGELHVDTYVNARQPVAAGGAGFRPDGHQQR